MRRYLNVFAAIGVFGVLLTSRATADDQNFKPIFDGKTLDGWDGDPRLWRVENGAIVGQTTPQNFINKNTFLIWRGGKPADFELKIEFKLANHNSGVQYRSREEPEQWGKWIAGGYQADIAQAAYTGILYEERGRGIVALQGQKVTLAQNQKPKVAGEFAKPADILKLFKLGEWNQCHIIAEGNHLRQFLNGQLTVDVTDDDPSQRRADGIIALQLHAGPPMKVEFRNILLKELPPKK